MDRTLAVGLLKGEGTGAVFSSLQEWDTPLGSKNRWHPEFRLTAFDAAVLSTFIKNGRPGDWQSLGLQLTTAKRLAEPAVLLPAARPSQPMRKSHSLWQEMGCHLRATILQRRARTACEHVARAVA